MGEFPPAKRFQHWIVPSSQDVKTKDGLDWDQQPPVSPASPLLLTIRGWVSSVSLQTANRYPPTVSTRSEKNGDLEIVLMILI